MKKRPGFVIGLASFSAVLLCTVTSPMLGCCAVAALVCVLLPLSFIKKLSMSPRVIAAAGIAALLLVCGIWRQEVAVVRPQLALDGTVGRATMRVEQALPTENAYIVQVESGDIPKGIRLCFWSGFRPIAPQNGDLIVADVEVLAAYDAVAENGHSAKANGVYLYAWPTGDGKCYWLDGQNSCPPIERALYALRGAIHDTLYRCMGFDEAALCEGILIGERGNLSTAIGDAFRASGVYHLLAVSGSHLSILTVILFRVFSGMRCSRRTACLVTACCVVAFTALCGFAASVVRAAAMMLLMLLGNMFRRRADGLNSLGLSAFVLLLADPFCAYDLGWQLSFAATFGLLVLTPVWSKEVTARAVKACPSLAWASRPLCEAVGVSLCASLATAPLSILYFGEISALFLAGNLLCVPLSSVVLILGFSGMLTVWLVPLARMLFAVCDLVLQGLIRYTAWLAEMPFSVVTVHGIWTAVVLTASVAGAMLAYRRCRLRGLLAVTVAAAVLLTGTYMYEAAQYERVSYVKSAASDCIAVAVMTNGTVGLIAEANGDNLKNASKLLRDEGVLRVDWMLWLDKPSVQATDVQALRVSVDELLLLASASQFPLLPDAQEMTVLPFSEPYMFTENGCLSYDNTALRLELADVSVVIQKKGIARIMTVKHHGTEETVVFCGHSDIDTQAAHYPDAHFAVEETWTYLLA